MSPMGMAAFSALTDKQVQRPFYRAIDVMNKGLNKFNTAVRSTLPGFKHTTKFFKDIGSVLKNIGSLGLDMFGVLMQMGQAMGILEPLMQIFAGILSIIGGVIMESGMMEKIQELAEFLFGGTMMEFWTEIGTLISDFFIFLLDLIMGLLGDPSVRKFLTAVLKAIISIVVHLAKVFGFLIKVLSAIPIQILGTIIYFMAIMFAFMKGVSAAPGIAGIILGAALAAIVAVALAPLLALEAGAIVTGPTLAMIGEGSEPEAVVPLSKAGEFGFGGGSEDVLYATEETNEKLNRVIGLLETQNRLKRFKYL